MNPNNPSSFDKSYKLQVTSYKFLIPILVIIILSVVAIIVSLPKKEKSAPYQLIIPDNTEVNVIKSSSELPDIPAIEKNATDNNSPQQGPATTQDLGNDVNQSISTEDLLKGKEIEIKR